MLDNFNNNISPRQLSQQNNERYLASPLLYGCEAPILGIDRHRIDCDGEGITTLVAFYGCPLDCKYCLNPECHNQASNWMSPQQLYDNIKIDDIYFRATKGGITFGGGEPLNYPCFITEFHELCNSHRWSINVETSLNVPLENLQLCASSIDTFFIDLKCISNKQYIAYTGKSNDKVLKNLKWLANHRDTNSVIVRIPTIPQYTTIEDIEAAKLLVVSLGFSNTDCFRYVVPSELEKARETRINAGKTICQTLKRLRLDLAERNGLIYHPVECTYEGPCRGTCPKCDAELHNITTYLNVLERNNIKIII